MATEEDPQKKRAFEHEMRRACLEMNQRAPLLSGDEIGLFEWHLSESESVIARMEEAAEAYVRDQRKADAPTVDGSDGDNADNGDNGDMVPIAYHIKRVRYSSVIFLASSLETFLKRACDTLRRIVGEQNARFGPDELKGEKWTQRKKFLETYGDFELPAEPWSTLLRLYEVRNLLVHEGGEVAVFTNAQKKTADDYVKSLPGVSLSSGEIVIGVEFLRGGLAAFAEVAEFVEARLQAVTDRALRPRSVG